MGSSSSRAATRALFKRLGDSLPSLKKRSLKDTQPICRLSSSSGSLPSPMMSSVLPPPMSHDQAPARLGRHGVRHARIDQARLFHAGDDFDRDGPSASRARSRKACLRRAPPQRIGADDAHAVGVHVAQPLAEALQAGERARRHVLVDAAVLLDACAQAHHFAQAIHDDDLAVDVARHDHVEAVGAQIDRRQDVGNRMGGHARSRQRREGCGDRSLCQLRSRGHQAVNEDPHPQVVVALGLRITNCAPSSPSR